MVVYALGAVNRQILRVGSAVPATAILTEASIEILTEAGDFLVTE